MTDQRYRELLTEGPKLTKGDFSRLKEFRPKKKRMVWAVWRALYGRIR